MYRSRTRGGATGYVSYYDATLAEYPDLTPEPYVRPADWLALPTVTDTQEKIAALVAVVPGAGNVVSLLLNTAVNVDWGDGSAVQAYAANAKIEHNYDYNTAALAGTDTTRGYRQAVMVITPQSGGFGNINFQQRSSLVYASGTAYCAQPFLDLLISSPAATSLTLMSSTITAVFPLLEKISIYTPLVAPPSYMFYYMRALRQVARVKMANGGSRSNWFAYCDSLEEVPDLDLTGATVADSMFMFCTRLKKPPVLNNSGSLTNTTSMFVSCSQLRTAPLFDTSNVTDMTSMFSGCSGLLRVPVYNTIKVAVLSGTFNGCGVLETLPVWNTSAVTNMTTTFANCSSLAEAPLWDTSKVNNFTQTFQNCPALDTFPSWSFAAALTLQSMFYNCYLLETVPALNLPVAQNLSQFLYGCRALKTMGALTTSVNLTNLTQMFQGCTQLEIAPSISVTSAVSTANQMFYSCYRLRTVPAYSLASCTNVNSMFQDCYALEAVPAFNLGNVAVNNFGNFVSGCYSLGRILATGMKFTLSVQNTRLSGASLNELFTNLATVTTQTITITNTPGASTGSGVDRTIATNKGWSVSG